MTIFKRPSLKFGAKRKNDIPEGLWTKCPSCGAMIHHLALQENIKVCPQCDHHFTLSALERIHSLVDEGTFVEIDVAMKSADPLCFQGVASYSERLRTYQEKTGLLDAVRTGHALLGGHRLGIAAMDFHFLAGSLGSVVGEKITRIIEESTKAKQPMIIVSTSGGARMYEGMLSLMQLAKTSGALARHAQERLPYISILTNPTTAGVMASYATLGDIILAEPKSMIGFAGPRVIRETTCQNLPPGFQTAEFLLEHGLIDQIVPRSRMRSTLMSLLNYFAGKPISLSR